MRTALARAKGPVLKFMTEGSLQNTTGSKADRVKMASTKKGIENFLTNSLLEVRPMTIEKLQGRRDTVATVDEWLSCDIREDPIGAIEQGAAKNENYLIVAASSEGTVRNGCGDDIKMELMQILKGEYINPHVSIWYYKLDSLDEVGQPEMWLKANPNLGKTVSYETYQLDVERRRTCGTTFWPSGSTCRWKDTPISSLTRRHCATAAGITGRCPVRWEQTFRWATTSVRSPSCSRCRTDISA